MKRGKILNSTCYTFAFLFSLSSQRLLSVTHFHCSTLSPIWISVQSQVLKNWQTRIEIVSNLWARLASERYWERESILIIISLTHSWSCVSVILHFFHFFIYSFFNIVCYHSRNYFISFKYFISLLLYFSTSLVSAVTSHESWHTPHTARESLCSGFMRVKPFCFFHYSHSEKRNTRSRGMNLNEFMCFMNFL